jgi:hypothetical protein
VGRPYLYFLLLFFWTKLHAQELVTKKADQSIIYLDSTLSPCKAPSASYYGYIPLKNYYINFDPLLVKDQKYKLVYTPFSDTTFEAALRPMHGELVVYSDGEREKRFDRFYVFSLGTLVQIKEPSKKGSHLETSYLDSLKNGDQNTFTRYTSVNNIPIYKQYLNKNGNKTFSDKMYLGEHKTFRSKFKPILGLYWNLGPDEEMKHNSHTFLELGVTKKYLRGTYVKAVRKTYFDNLQAFHSVNLSLLGASRANQFFFGQKATYAYTYMFFKGEIGLMNYTDLKKDDARLIGGLGFSVMGSLSGMLYYSLPLTKDEFKDVGRIAIGFSFH